MLVPPFTSSFLPANTYVVCTSAFSAHTPMNCKSTERKGKCTCKAKRMYGKSICNKHRKSVVRARRQSSGSRAELSSTQPFYCLRKACGRYSSDILTANSALCVTLSKVRGRRTQLPENTALQFATAQYTG